MPDVDQQSEWVVEYPRSGFVATVHDLPDGRAHCTIHPPEAAGEMEWVSAAKSGFVSLAAMR